MSAPAIGAVFIAILAVAALPIYRRDLWHWWKRQAKGTKVGSAVVWVGGTVVVVVFVSAYFIEALGDDPATTASGAPAAETGGVTGTPECVLVGQVYDAEGEPMRGALIVARDPESYWEGLTAGVPESIATTDADGRFEGDCSDTPRPFLYAVNWEMVYGSDERCEWWGAPQLHVIGEDGAHRVNIQIPREEMEAGPYRYADDGSCAMYWDFG